MSKTVSFIIACISLCFLCTSCDRTDSAWENTKTMGRYLQRKGMLMWKKNTDSRQVQSEDEFTGPVEEEFIPLEEHDLRKQSAEKITPQPRETPSHLSHTLPTIERFLTPSHELAEIFQTIHFNTDDYTIRSKDYYVIIDKISDYLKQNKKCFVYIEGHCDERASQAYNLALGTKRANNVRELLIRRGIHPDRLFTISYGKEKPLDLGHTRESWAKNRRAAFKLYYANYE